MNADGWHIFFDKARRLVFFSGRPKFSFASVDNVQLEHFTNSRKFEWWVLSVGFLDGRKLKLGRSIDDVDVSIAAASVAKVLDKAVQTYKSSGL